MARVRFSTRWIVPPLLAVLLFTAVPGGLRAQSPKSLFPNATGSAQSSPLRRPSRRPPPPPRPDTVALPYNLVWGDSQNRLASLFAGVGAKIINKKAAGPTETWTVDGLIAPNLQASLFTFAQGNLIGLEFDYGAADWGTDRYAAMMDQFRRLLEAKCEKPGEAVPMQTDQPADSTVKQTLTGFQWKRGDTLVQLFYFSAEDTAKPLAYRSISVHYHYQDLMPDAPPLPDADRNADPNANALFGGAAKPAPGGTPVPATPTPAPSPQYGPPPPPTPTPKPGSRESFDPLPER